MTLRFPTPEPPPRNPSAWEFECLMKTFRRVVLGDLKAPSWHRATRGLRERKRARRRRRRRLLPRRSA